MKNIILPILFFFILPNLNAQLLERSIALLDLSERNSESNDSRLFSAQHMLKVAGIPFEVLRDPNEAMKHAVIFCSSQIVSNSFSVAEVSTLNNYVFEGGVLIAPRVLDDELFDLFGLSNFAASKNNYNLNWSETISTNLSRWIDEPEEWRISLGEDNGQDIFNTYAYQLSDALPIAHYEDGSVAAAQNQHGSGFAYAFGVSWRDVILRSQINRDYEAERITSNGFEPTQDVLMLLMRSIFCEHVPFSTWKHTSPANSTSTLIITHDVDSKTGMDSMLLFSASEKAMDIQANYNITLRYFSDGLMSDFYIGSESKITSIINQGHTLGSHSVGHFPDFASSNTFPIGSPGNTILNYTPSSDGSGTTGGSVFGECEVSKHELEMDHNVNIRSFRAGHLAYNNKLVDVLDSLGYEYNSSNSASDVLTHFPYQNKKGRSFSGAQSKVYEFGVSISDVFHSDPISQENYLEKADQWLDVHTKIDANNGTTILLIHPNRGYKLLGQEYFISQIPESVYITELNAYGDFWKAREQFNFETDLINDTMYVHIPNESLLLDDHISLIINNGQALDEIIALDENGNPINFTTENWENNDLVFYRKNNLITTVDNPIKSQMDIKIFPNPLKEQFTIELNLEVAAKVKVELFDLLGNLVQQNNGNFSAGKQNIQINLFRDQLAQGVYTCKINAGVNGIFSAKIFLE